MFKGPLEHQVYQNSHHEVAEREEREPRIENLFEKIMIESFLNLAKEIDIQIHNAHSPKQDKGKKPTIRHTIIK